MNDQHAYRRGFFPYAAAAFLIGLVGGFSTVLGPAFVADLGLAYHNTTWTALAQAVSTAACAPILGRVGDVIGRKRTLLAGIAAFTLGNVLSAAAGSLSFMLAARFLVGVGVAAMTPVIMAYIVAEFPQSEMSRGFSQYMLISSASVVVGPALGALIIRQYGWRVMLWLCSALCAAVLAVCAVCGGREKAVRGSLRGFDGPGAAFVVLFFGLALCVPSFGQNFGWRSGAFLAVLAAAAAALAGLILAERRAAQPILPGRFIRRRPFVLSVVTLFLTQGLMQANMTNTIVFVNYTRPESASVSGYAISAMYLGMSLGAVLLGPLADRVEPRRILNGSLLVTMAGCTLQFAFSAATPTVLLIAALGVLGFGLGANATILMRVALSGLSAPQAGAGTGTYGLFRDLSAPFGVAVFVPFFTNRVAALTAAGTAAGSAAVSALHTLAAAELCCAAAALITVRFLPGIHNKGGTT